MNISRFQITLSFRAMFSLLLTAGMVGLQNGGHKEDRPVAIHIHLLSNWERYQC